MINVVVSRYKRNTDYLRSLEKYNTNIMVYDKETPSNKYNVPFNKGNEASVYLKYIIDNYNNLSDYTFFIHDEDYSWHHDGSIETCLVTAMNSNELFFNVNHTYLQPYSHISEKEDLMKWYNKYIEPYIPYEKLPNKDWLSGYKACAQFLVHKSLILHLPCKFYIDIYNWINEFENYKLSGYFLEWTWHLFWVISPTYNIYNKSIYNESIDNILGSWKGSCKSYYIENNRLYAYLININNECNLDYVLIDHVITCHNINGKFVLENTTPILETNELILETNELILEI
jgi:hypothetical protein